MLGVLRLVHARRAGVAKLIAIGTAQSGTESEVYG